jgi:DNA-binding NarL/FixJ family response regulator
LIRILLADDQALIRSGIRSLLEAEDDIEVVAEAADGQHAVALAAHGLSNDEIADAMVLSPVTAKTHVSRAMIKLGARDRAQLVVFAYQTGLVTPRAAGQPPGH